MIINKQKNKQTNKQGVSLITLVITIIIMTILAGVVILTLSDTSIFDKANNAVSATNLKQAENIANLAWAEAYMDNIRGVDELQTAVNDAFVKNKINDKYKAFVTEKGVKVKEIGTFWELVRKSDTDIKVKKGKQEIAIGTVVNYMPEGVGDTSYTGGWKILGVDDDGRLLISMSQLIDVTQNLYSYNLLSVLKETVSSYKDGVYGIEVRSLKDEDFDPYDKLYL